MIFRSAHAPVVVPDVSLTDLVFAGAHAYRDRAALADGLSGRVITFGELVDQVRRVAAGLAKRIGKGDVVAICSPNVPEFAVVFHAVVRIGGILTTVNPAYTADEIAFQLRDAGARLLITTAGLADRAREAVKLASTSVDIFTIDEAPGLPSLAAIAIDGEPPHVVINPSTDVVVLPYSSGTTGLPKGVMLTHRNLVANLAQIDALESRELSALVGVLPFFHIYGMVVLMNFALMRGLTAVTLPRFELDAFLRVLQDWRIELAHVAPPIIVALAKHPAVNNYDLSRLKWLFSGAAPLGAEVTDAVERRLSVKVRQGYGMTECSPASHYTPPGCERQGKAGLLVPNTEGVLVDPATGERVGPGVPGEVWIRGPQVMKGYLNNPEATAVTVDSEGWLHTGDIGVVDEDGYLEITDRLKELIKVKGYQVAPAELEALLLKHPQIADAAVIPIPDADAGERPKAFVVATGALSSEQVMQFVDVQVAHYKRLAQVAFIDAIPKSPSGKILRRVLVERERSRAHQ
jgi:acyl-CoA synthetase (AMP-forming)/AMP-acid ligase II